MFFVISGFLITTNSLRRWGSLEAIDARRFYQLRFARIMPLLAVLLAVLSLLHLAGVADYVINPNRASLGRALLAAVTFHINWLEAKRAFYLPFGWDVLWSLSIEEVFYLLFPLGSLAFRWRWWGYALLVSLVIVGPWLRWTLVDQRMWQSKGYLCCVDAIALGCLTALVTHRRPLSGPLVKTLLGVGSVLALLTLAYGRADALGPVGDRRLHLTVLSIALAALLVAGVRVQMGGAARAWLRPLLACGRLSYEIYLTHGFVVLTAVAAHRRLGSPPSLVYPVLAATLVACWALGTLVERFLSGPANRLLRQWFMRRAAAATPLSGSHP